MSPRASTAASTAAYLARIGYRGGLEPTPVTLRALHRAHLRAIPYENLDLHLGRRLPLDPEAAFDKLVTRRRGGWCYEMNGLFAWALETLGFEVRLLAGGVGWETLGRRARGNHLVLLVMLDRPYLADVGFGDGFLDPLPLVPGRYRQGFLEFVLERREDRWVLHNHPAGSAPSFDFGLEPWRLEDFSARSEELQTSPDSAFVQKTVCQRHTRHGLATLRGAVLRTLTSAGGTERTVATAEEYDRVLRRIFGLRIEEVDGLWERVRARHQRWLASGGGQGKIGETSGCN